MRVNGLNSRSFKPYRRLFGPLQAPNASSRRPTHAQVAEQDSSLIYAQLWRRLLTRTGEERLGWDNGSAISLVPMLAR